ncbi:MAG: aromatic aminobenezylarsenical efflux permease ArsG family transporter [Candidatus Aphodosoma sp.]
MEYINALLESETVPALTAILLGLMTAISPCPMGTNIVAIGYISRDLESRKKIFLRGLLYTLGRTIGYTALSIALIMIIKGGSSMFGVQKFFTKYSEMFIGPILMVVGVFMLIGDKLKLPSFNFNNEKIKATGNFGALLLGILFALAFCPTSGLFYFGMLIPMSATATAGYLLPILFAIATSLPVIIIAWILAFSAKQIGVAYGKIQSIQKWMNLVVGILFTDIGVYYTITILII